MYACSKVILLNLFRYLNYKINQLSFSHRQFVDEKIIEQNWQRIPIETYKSSIDSKLSVLLMLCSLTVFSVAFFFFSLVRTDLLLIYRLVCCFTLNKLSGLFFYASHKQRLFHSNQRNFEYSSLSMGNEIKDEKKDQINTFICPLENWKRTSPIYIFYKTEMI